MGHYELWSRRCLRIILPKDERGISVRSSSRQFPWTFRGRTDRRVECCVVFRAPMNCNLLPSRAFAIEQRTPSINKIPKCVKPTYFYKWGCIHCRNIPVRFLWLTVRESWQLYFCGCQRPALSGRHQPLWYGMIGQLQYPAAGSHAGRYPLLPHHHIFTMSLQYPGKNGTRVCTIGVPAKVECQSFHPCPKSRWLR